MALGCGLLGCSEPRDTGPVEAPAEAALSVEVGPSCAVHDPLRQAFFGDVHIHTSYSMDAYTADVRATPADAYRFARGEPIALAGGRTAQLERPLDFAAVSDHAEYLGEVSLCTTPGSPGYAGARCSRYRGEVEGMSRGARMGVLLDQAPPFVELGPFPKLGRPVRSPELCGEGLERCREAAASVWRASGQAAERWHDDTEACLFTTFHAYEYTWTPQLSKIHRNVIFRSAVVPELPISSVEAVTPRELWLGLERECLQAGNGCDALAIPHNPNLSNGRMFRIGYRDVPEAQQAAHAALQARLEPLVEIMQVKGDSECRNGFSGVVGGPDEFCDFEKFRGPEVVDCGDETGIGALAGAGCASRLDFVRYALIEGLREQARIGVNPLKLGITASTDSHNATPGDTEEYSYDGAHGSSEATAAQRLGTGDIVPPTRANPGGLMGVWAEENSRDSLFDAMRRRETFGTSGVRIRPRFFGGWDYDEALCSRHDAVELAYARGAAMGGDLPARRDEGGAPVFLASALRDPGTRQHPGGRLERIQVIKGWVGADGSFHQAAHDVAVDDELAGTVDPQTCAPAPGGADQLCGVWRDPDFDPERPAVYYARVLERPSCRWTAYACLSLPAAERPPACDDASIPRAIQERAWTSPIWYEPPDAPLR
jgi:hypothetical protein